MPKSQIEITARIPAQEFDATRSDAIKNLGRDIEIPGFRNGHAPEKILEAKLGNGAIDEEMARIAIGRAYPSIIVEEKIEPLGHPDVKIIKIATGNPLEFTITTAVFPDITLPNYKKLAAMETKKKEVVEVTDDDVNKTIEQLRRMRAGHAPHEHGGEDHSHEETELPPFDDEFVRSLGGFENIEDFRTKLRDNILKEKEREARDKKRVAMIEAIMNEATIDLPDIIVEQEINRMEDEFARNIEEAGMTLDAYLKAVQKTQGDLRKEWRPDAEKRAKIQLIASSIAREENIVPDKEKLDREVAALSERYPDTDRGRIIGFVGMLMTNEKVFDFLESQE